jgi:hypothetical protein
MNETGLPLTELAEPDDRARISEALTSARIDGAAGLRDVRLCNYCGTYQWSDIEANKLSASDDGAILLTCHERHRAKQSRRGRYDSFLAGTQGTTLRPGSLTGSDADGAVKSATVLRGRPTTFPQVRADDGVLSQDIPDRCLR